jgi:glycerol uptake facilitator-like aquaporin
MRLLERAGAEALGTAFLLAAVVGSGIMGEQLAGGNVALALLANSIATGGALAALILALAPASGAHFNPVVTLVMAAQGRLNWRELPAYWLAQFGGAVLGVVAAQLMFGEPLLAFSTKARAEPALVSSEFIATCGLLMVIQGAMHSGVGAVAAAVACYITAAYWFTASTSFANPAVTLARTLTDTFAGIRPQDAPAFIAMQFLAGAVVVSLQRLSRRSRSR